MSTEIAIGLASFLGGSLLTVVLFVIPLVGKLSRLETNLQNLSKKLDMLETNRPVCSYHTEISESTAVTEQRLKAIEERLAAKNV
jgi:hypothetical protein